TPRQHQTSTRANSKYPRQNCPVTKVPANEYLLKRIDRLPINPPTTPEAAFRVISVISVVSGHEGQEAPDVDKNTVIAPSHAPVHPIIVATNTAIKCSFDFEFHRQTPAHSTRPKYTAGNSGALKYGTRIMVGEAYADNIADKDASSASRAAALVGDSDNRIPALAPVSFRCFRPGAGAGCVPCALGLVLQGDSGLSALELIPSSRDRDSSTCVSNSGRICSATGADLGRRSAT